MGPLNQEGLQSCYLLTTWKGILGTLTRVDLQSNHLSTKLNGVFGSLTRVGLQSNYLLTKLRGVMGPLTRVVWQSNLPTKWKGVSGAKLKQQIQNLLPGDASCPCITGN